MSKPGSRAAGSCPQAARLAAAPEAQPALWRARFSWLLRQGMLQTMSGAPLHPERLRGQFALRLPPAGAGPEQEAAFARLIRALVPLLGQGAAVAIDLPCGQQPAATQLAQLEHALGSRLAPLALRPLNLSFSVFPAPAGRELLRRLPASRCLGYPAALARLPDGLLAALHCGEGWAPAGQEPESAAAVFEELTLLSWTAPAVALVLAGTSRPSCELGPAEPLEGVLPQSLFEAPGETAWLTLSLHLGGLAGAEGPEGWQRRLRRTVRLCLRLAENLLEQIDWPSARLQSDARENRRIALHLAGVGELVDRCRLDPRRVTTLRRVESWLAEVRRVMRDESRRLARSRGAYPALRLTEVADRLNGRCGVEPTRRFLQDRVLRHRHLLVASPWMLLPPGGSRHPAARYFDLLPALRFADSIGLYGGALRHRLDLEDYRRLLRMTWAVARNRA